MACHSGFATAFQFGSAVRSWALPPVLKAGSGTALAVVGTFALWVYDSFDFCSSKAPENYTSY
jgi:hypothetical protein